MSKRTNNKKAKQSSPAVPIKKSVEKNPSKPSNITLHLAIIALFAFILYFNTLQNGFAFDDSVVITGNNFTKEGIKGIPALATHDLFAGIYGQSLELTGGRFRPIPLITHALEYQFWGEAHPGCYHFINILLYALAGFMMFLLLKKILNGATLISFIATLIFIVHPIHTEVVANIKSRDEILCFIFLMLTLFYLFRAVNESSKKYFGISLLFYLLSLLTKENGITFLAVIPLVLYFFTKEKTKDIFKRSLPFIVIAVVYLLVRSALLHTASIKDSTDIMENPFYGIAFGEKLATISHIMGKYLLLMFFPHPLSCDYSYNQIPFIGWSSIDALIPLLIHLALLVYAIATCKKKNIFSFCILFYFITISIVTNVFFNIGAPMGERFVFLPSFAFCLAASIVITKLVKTPEKSTALIPVKLYLPLLIIFIPSTYKTITRNKDWKNDETLFSADVKTVPNSGKAHYYYGNLLFSYYTDSLQSPRRKYLIETAKQHTLIASQIAPNFFFAHLNLGNIYYEEGNSDSAIYHYNRVVAIIPPSSVKENGVIKINSSKTYIQAMQDLARCWAMMKKSPDKGIEILNTALKYQPDDALTLEYLGICNLMKGDNTSALNYFNKSLQLKPDNAEALNYLGQMYQFAKNTLKAKEYFDKANQLKVQH